MFPYSPVCTEKAPSLEDPPALSIRWLSNKLQPWFPTGKRKSLTPSRIPRVPGETFKLFVPIWPLTQKGESASSSDHGNSKDRGQEKGQQPPPAWNFISNAPSPVVNVWLSSPKVTCIPKGKYPTPGHKRHFNQIFRPHGHHDNGARLERLIPPTRETFQKNDISIPERRLVLASQPPRCSVVGRLSRLGRTFFAFRCNIALIVIESIFGARKDDFAFIFVKLRHWFEESPGRMYLQCHFCVITTSAGRTFRGNRSTSCIISASDTDESRASGMFVKVQRATPYPPIGDRD